MDNIKVIKDFFDSRASTWDDFCHHDQRKLEMIANLACIKDGDNVLDIGCGTGIMENYILEYNPKHVLGVDLSHNMIEQAKKKINDSRVEFLEGNIYDLDILNYNVAIFYNSYPHFLDKENLIKKIYTMLSENGRIIIAHSDSRHKINNTHSKSNIVNNISKKLDKAYIEAEKLHKYFDIDTMIDTDKMFLISGFKK